MKSFRDPTTNVLKAYGFALTNAPGDLARDEPDDFNLTPGKWQLVAGTWAAYIDKNAQRSLIDAQRDAKLLLGVPWNTHSWRTDDVFQAQLTSLIAAFTNSIIPVGSTVNVRTMDAAPVSVAMTLADLKSLAGAVLQYVQGVYSQSWTEKDAL